MSRRRGRVLGSAGASPAGFGASPKRTLPEQSIEEKLAMAGAPSPAGEAPALPRVLFVAWLLFLALSATSCRRGMVDQQHLKPLAEENFFADGRAARMPPAHTVARGELRADEQFYTGKIGDQLAATFPRPVTRQTLERGRERYEIYCIVCHGPTGEGNGMIVQRGFPAPPSLHEPRLREAPPGHFFNVMTNGYGVMFSYAARVAPEDRWAIAAYIRALQLSQHATPSDADSAGRRQLETAAP